MASTTDSVQIQLRADLMSAMKARDADTVRTLRTVLAAIANAEAPSIDSAPREVVGELVQHDRVVLTAGDIDAVLRAQIADRVDTAATYRANGRAAEAGVVDAEIALIERYLR